MRQLTTLSRDAHCDTMSEAEQVGWHRPGPDSLGEHTAAPFAVYYVAGRLFRVGRAADGGFVHYPYTGRLDALHLSAVGDDRDCCPACGESRIVALTPVVAGPDGWGARCKSCGHRWS